MALNLCFLSYFLAVLLSSYLSCVCISSLGLIMPVPMLINPSNLSQNVILLSLPIKKYIIFSSVIFWLVSFSTKLYLYYLYSLIHSFNLALKCYWITLSLIAMVFGKTLGECSLGRMSWTYLPRSFPHSIILMFFPI